MEDLVEMSRLNKFWFGKKVLITGITGFKGSWLALWLNEMGADVYGFALKPKPNQPLFNEFLLEDNTTTLIGDVCDYNKLMEFVRLAEPDFIFHMAAQSLVSKGFENPVQTLKTNILGTANVLEVCSKLDHRCVLINITSDKCYKNADRTAEHFTEDSQLGGDDIYSASKACAEIIHNSYDKSFLEVKSFANATVRAGNVIGGGDFSENRIFTDIYNAVKNREKLALRSPAAVRPWQHVIDCIHGYLMLARNLSESSLKNGAWNFGPKPSESLSVYDLCHLASELFKSKIGYGFEFEFVESLFSEKVFLSIDPQKSMDQLGWRQLWKNHEAVEMTVDWYVSFLSKDDMLQKSKLQLEAFSKRIGD